MLSALRKTRLATAVLAGLSDRCRIQRPRNALDFDHRQRRPGRESFAAAKVDRCAP